MTGLFFDKKIFRCCVKSEITLNQEFPIIRKLEKQKTYSFFNDNIWGADLAGMQSISKFNKDLAFYYVLLMFIVNMHVLFL